MKGKGKLISLKILTDRVKNQLGVANFLMLIYVFALSSSYPIWIILPGMIIIALVLGYIDYRFILPKEYDKVTKLNPFMVEMKKDLVEIKEMLKNANGVDE